MADKKILKTTIALRRDTINNYAAHSTHIPYKGEVCIVDPTATSPWAKAKNIRIKIGDGVNTWANLPYIDQENSSAVYGYYFDSKFYRNIEHTIQFEVETGVLYLDLHEGIIYYFDGEKLLPNVSKIATADEDTPGIMKLYTKLGYNEDGTMSQKAITDAINAINLEVSSTDNELFELVKPSVE